VAESTHTIKSCDDDEDVEDDDEDEDDDDGDGDFRGPEVAGSAQCNQRATSAPERSSRSSLTRLSVSGSDLSIVSIPPPLGERRRASPRRRDRCRTLQYRRTELDRRRDQEDDLGARR